MIPTSLYPINPLQLFNTSTELHGVRIADAALADVGFILMLDNKLPKTPAGYRRAFIPESQQWILDKIRIMNPFGEFIFVRDNGARMRTFDVRDRLRLICKKVGIPPKSPHKIRKTYASILLDNGIDEKVIIGQMGHTSILCTEKHYHRDRRRRDEKQKIFNSIPELKAK